MVQIADEIGQSAPRDPMAPLIQSTFTDAIDTVSNNVDHASTILTYWG